MKIGYNIYVICDSSSLPMGGFLMYKIRRDFVCKSMMIVLSGRPLHLFQLDLFSKEIS